MLANGFGEHNIQGISVKHVPLIHNVMNTDLVAAVSDRATDQLSVLFAAGEAVDYLRTRRGVPEPVFEGRPAFGLSTICNILAAVKLARLPRVHTVQTFGVPPSGARLRTRPRAAAGHAKPGATCSAPGEGGRSQIGLHAAMGRRAQERCHGHARRRDL
jgi:hypothetical protein